MLEIRNISKSFDGVQAVQDVSLSVPSHQITSIIGPNGAGKTTLFNILTGFLETDQGEALFRNESLLGAAPWRISRRGISRTFQNLRLFKKLTVLENVLLGIPAQSDEDLFHALLRFSGTSPEHLSNVRRAEELIEFSGLTSHRNELAENLSYGQQKLLSMACCLAGNPDLLLLDEPVAGVQPATIEKIEEMIRTLVREEKKTVC